MTRAARPGAGTALSILSLTCMFASLEAPPSVWPPGWLSQSSNLRQVKHSHPTTAQGPPGKQEGIMKGVSGDFWPDSDTS